MKFNLEFKGFWTFFRNTSTRWFNTTSEKYLDRFQFIRSDLKRANIPTMLREYVAMCIFSAVFAFALAIPTTVLALFLLGKTGLFLIMALPISLGVAATAFVVALKYPATKADERERNIRNNLPFATLYMNTIAGTGAPPYMIFKLLADFKEYGQISVEAQGIVEDIEVKGQDIEVALKRAAERTPSQELRDLFWSMVTTIVRGGDLRSLLQEKAYVFMQDYRRRMREYTNDLSLYVEVYITLVIVGSIFGLVMSTILGTISGFAGLQTIQQALVFVFLPMASIVFLFLLKITSPIS